MKTTDASTLAVSARINKFLDRKLARSIDVNDIESYKLRRSHRQMTDVNDSPFIALAIN